MLNFYARIQLDFEFLCMNYIRMHREKLYISKKSNYYVYRIKVFSYFRIGSIYFASECRVYDNQVRNIQEYLNGVCIKKKRRKDSLVREVKCVRH